MAMHARRAGILVTVLVLAGCETRPDADLDLHRALVRQFAEATNTADWDALAAIVADDFVRHDPSPSGPVVRSRDEFIELQKTFLVAFPDQRVATEAMVADDDLVAIRAVYTGTHTGPMLGPGGEVPATGRRVELPFLGIFRIESGRIQELWLQWDQVTLLGQLGLMPPAGGG